MLNRKVVLLQALIDADILLYEIGHISEFDEVDAAGDKTGEHIIWKFDRVADLLDEKINSINEDSGATGKPKLFLSSIKHFYKDKFLPNFREELAVSKPYKGTRKNEKPFHYYNIYHHLAKNYDTKIANGFEADDLMGIEQCSRGLETVICSRDKDLRMIPGFHYGWECGKQGEFITKQYSDLGEIELVTRKDANGKSKDSKIVGGGKAFFFNQCLTGDVVDNIGGLDRCGPVKAFNLLSECRDEGEYKAVVEHAYKDKYGEEHWYEKLQEQSRLLWIWREKFKFYEGWG